MNIVNSYYEPCDEVTRKLILEKCESTPEKFEDDVKTIKEWLKYQPHLPKNFAENIIRMYLTLTSCSIEITKNKIDWYFSIRRFFPQIFENSHPLKAKRLEMGRKITYFITMPHLNNKIDRVLFIKYKDHDIDNVQLQDAVTYGVNWLDIAFQFEFTPSFITVVDLQHFRLSYVNQISPTNLKAMFSAIEKTMHFKFSGLHLINVPNYGINPLTFIKPFMKQKLYERIHVHENFESLKDLISVDCIPKDYGGNAKSLDELEELMSDTLAANKDFFDERENWKVDENLRPQKLDDDLEIFGLSGNFKQLEFD